MVKLGKIIDRTKSHGATYFLLFVIVVPFVLGNFWFFRFFEVVNANRNITAVLILTTVGVFLHLGLRQSKLTFLMYLFSLCLIFWQNLSKGFLIAKSFF